MEDFQNQGSTGENPSQAKINHQRRSQADKIVDIANSNGITLFHTPGPVAFARIDFYGHLETQRCNSSIFKQFMAYTYWQKEGKIPSADAIRAALTVIEGQANFDGEEYRLHNRVAWYEGNLWYDLATQDWEAVVITPDGWHINYRPPILFRRFQHQLPQVEPVYGGDASSLLNFINVHDKEKSCLILSSLIVSFIPDIPHPIFYPYGHKGSAKTFYHRLLKRIIDPSMVEVMFFPRDVNELAQRLYHHYALFFDNVSYLPNFLADCLCRAVTGEGFTKRQLFTDDDDVIYSFKRVIGVNGINIASKKPDFLDRCLLVELERIPPEQRREESKLLARFDEERPSILGGIFDTLVKAMQLYPKLEIANLPRMADFTRWGCAIAEVLGYGAETFFRLYQNNIAAQNEEALSSSPVGAAIVVFMEGRERWQGTPAALLGELEKIAEKEKIDVRAKGWPKAAHILSRQVKEIEPNLNDAGIKLKRLARSGSRGRRIVITRALEDMHNSDTSDTSDTPATEIGKTGVATASGQKIATSVATPQSSFEHEEHQLQGVAGITSVAKLPTSKSDIEQTLGMTIEQAVNLWEGEGAPVIHLAPGENTEHLDKLLHVKEIKPGHVEAITKWLREHNEQDDLDIDFLNEYE